MPIQNNSDIGPAFVAATSHSCTQAPMVIVLAATRSEFCLTNRHVPASDQSGCGAPRVISLPVNLRRADIPRVIFILLGDQHHGVLPQPLVPLSGELGRGVRGCWADSMRSCRRPSHSAAPACGKSPACRKACAPEMLALSALSLRDANGLLFFFKCMCNKKHVQTTL